MASDPLPARSPLRHFLVLTRFRALQARNTVDQQLREAPIRTFMVLLLLGMIWASLYLVLEQVLRQIGRWEMGALVAQQQIFIHFFLVLAVMLAFSNAILAFSSLFGRDEAGHLLTMPASARQVVCLKWLEGMLLSSWSFLLLGVPLMLAVARTGDVEWYYYPLFIGHFLGFVLVPSTFGLLAAWAVARWAPRRPMTLAILCGSLILALVVFWAWTLLRNADGSEKWLRHFFLQLNVARQPLLPSTWSAKGVIAAIEQRADLSLFYLGAVLANGLFFGWVTVNLIAHSWPEAYSRARQGRGSGQVRTGWTTATLCHVFFFYLPAKMRTLMLKDLRGFARDPTQWTQMVIMLGLLVVYAANLRRFPILSEQPNMRAVAVFLNLAAVSLIMATITSRFVYPLLSLESQQLWLLGLVPVPRFHILLVKFVLSVTVTGVATLVVMGLALQALELDRAWAALQLAVCLGICVGLSGLAVGLGARFPVLGQRNPARISSGFGGTLNLIASMLFVTIEIGGLAVTGLLRAQEAVTPETATNPWLVATLLLTLSFMVAAGAMAFGWQHFRRLEY